MQTPDFDIVERTWESRLRDRGLTPARVGAGIACGYERLELHREETQVVEFDIEPLGHGFLASVEVKVIVAEPMAGEYEIRDLITQKGPSVDAALAACANTFMDVTFPPLEALFTGKHPEGPGTGTLTLTSYNLDRGLAIQWDVVLGSLQILDDPDSAVRERLQAQPPVSMVLDTLIGHVSTPRLHWCKLYGANRSEAGFVFGCAIDGQKSPEAEAEMASKFPGDPQLPGEWEFRQFLLIRPTGDADPAIAADLRARAAAMYRPLPAWKRWLSRLLGE